MKISFKCSVCNSHIGMFERNFIDQAYLDELFLIPDGDGNAISSFSCDNGHNVKIVLGGNANFIE